MTTTSSRAAIAMLCGLIMQAWTGAVMAQTEIVWRVEQPFRFFSDPRDAEVHRKAFLTLPQNERSEAVLAIERALAAKNQLGWAAQMHGQTCWDGDRVRGLCPGAGPYIKPSKHRVVARINSREPLDASVQCHWFVTVPPAKGSTSSKTRKQKPFRQELRRSCQQEISFDVPYPQGSQVTVERDGVRLAATEIEVEDLFVVGLGDSFASGEGNPDIPIRLSSERSVSYGEVKRGPGMAGYPARVGSWSQIGDPEFIKSNAVWLDQACHRSLYSHQLRTALQLAIEDPHRSVTFLGLACSGATIVDGFFLRYKGHEWVPNPPILSQISAVAAAQCEGHDAPWQDLPEAYHINGQIPDLQGGLKLRKCDAKSARRIDLLMVSIGGNDVGFARLVANAVLPNSSTLRTLGGWLGQVHGATEATARFNELKARYKSLNRAIHYILHIPWEQSDRVLMTGYPPLALMEDGRSVCPDGNAGMDVIDEFNLTRAKAVTSNGVATALHRVMRDAATEHNWTFVDSHRRKFLGRGICAGYVDSALNTVDDLRIPRRVDGVWNPYNPAEYKPYASRQRWFRTPNDAFLTGNFHVSTSLFQTAAKRMQNLQWLQLLLAATYSGAFHPTAEGQAAIADAVAEKARAVLARHDQGVRGDPFAWAAEGKATGAIAPRQPF